LESNNNNNNNNNNSCNIVSLRVMVCLRNICVNILPKGDSDDDDDDNDNNKNNNNNIATRQQCESLCLIFLVWLRYGR
jgi:hypothetical protein